MSALAALQAPAPAPGTASIETGLWWAYRRRGRRGSRAMLVELYQRWAESRARSYARSRGIDWNELRGAAVLGLMESVNRFDPSEGVPFRAFAARRIDGAILDAARDSMGRASRNRPAPARELEFGCPSEFIPDDNIPAREPEPSHAAEMGEVERILLEAMEPGREREIAERRFLMLQPIDEIAHALGLGRSQVDAILRERCLPKARRTLRALGIRPERGKA